MASNGVLVQQGEPITYGGMRDTDSFQIRQTDDTYIFQSWRQGNMRYSIPISSGTYMVVIWFLESEGGTMAWEWGRASSATTAGLTT